MSELGYKINGQYVQAEALQSWVQIQLERKVPIWERDHLLFIQEWFSAQPFITAFTSGSAGEPKEIRLSREAMKKSALLTADYFQLHHPLKALLALPSSFIAGKMMIVRALILGWDLVWLEPMACPIIPADQSFGFAAFTPMQVSALIKKDSKQFSCIDNIIIGGGPTSTTLLNQLRAFPNRIALTYGMTETITHVAIREVSSVKEEFIALNGVSFSTDERNCLVIHAEHIGSEAIVTNDFVDLRSPKEFILLGRIDHVINSGGLKFFPDELENLLAEFINLPMIVTSIEDEVLGQKIILQIEGSETKMYSSISLLKELKQKANSLRFIREVRFVKSFDRTSAGKIIRKVY